MNISKREKILIFAVVLLALIGGYYLYYLKPCLDEIQTLNADIADKQLQLSASVQEQSQLDQLEAKIADADEQLALFGGSIAQTFDQPPVLVYISETVSTRAQKGAIYFEQPIQIGQIERCAITVTMTVTYAGLKTVLNAFSDAPYLIRVTQLYAEIATSDAMTDTAMNVAGTTGTDSTTGTLTGTEPPQPTPPVNEVLEVKLVLDFYSLSGEIPEGTTYTFDTTSQYGGDIFY